MSDSIYNIDGYYTLTTSINFKNFFNTLNYAVFSLYMLDKHYEGIHNLTLI